MVFSQSGVGSLKYLLMTPPFSLLCQIKILIMEAKPVSCHTFRLIFPDSLGHVPPSQYHYLGPRSEHYSVSRLFLDRLGPVSPESLQSILFTSQTSPPQVHFS